LIVTYTDPDGTNTEHQVRVSLRRFNRATNSIATVATFDSNKLNINTVSEQLKLFNHSFDFRANYYYVEIALTRTNTATGNPRIYAVRLARANEVPQ
jgi:hypothetical protein